MKLPRSTGTLLHPTSLPGKQGIGTLDECARQFVRKLAKGSQSWWQILPLHPPGHGGSPYSAISAFAGNELLIDLETLVSSGWLAREPFEEYCMLWTDQCADRYDYGAVESAKNKLLQLAYDGWCSSADYKNDDFVAFCKQHSDWLDDYSLYVVIKALHDGNSWQEWVPEYAQRKPSALKQIRKLHAPKLECVQFKQWVFWNQWTTLRQYAALFGVKIIGDMPIFVAMDSADTWANRDLFQLDEYGLATHISGVPPDYFSEEGQRWGNPLYRWEHHKKSGFRWWIRRLENTLSTVDIVRIDHFRGFESYWRIPAEEETAINGTWESGPGDAFFEAIRAHFGDLPLIAEDLGEITDDVIALRDRHGLPGMRILQFAFDGDPDNAMLPDNYPENCVVFTGTHDNDTSRGWYDKLDAIAKHDVRCYLHQPDENIVSGMIESLLGSKADVVIIPYQDLLGLDSSARMNTPGRDHDNWNWRITPPQFDNQAIWQQLAYLNHKYGRSAR